MQWLRLLLLSVACALLPWIRTSNANIRLFFTVNWICLSLSSHSCGNKQQICSFLLEFWNSFNNVNRPVHSYFINHLAKKKSTAKIASIHANHYYFPSKFEIYLFKSVAVCDQHNHHGIITMPCIILFSLNFAKIKSMCMCSTFLTMDLNWVCVKHTRAHSQN